MCCSELVTFPKMCPIPASCHLQNLCLGTFYWVTGPRSSLRYIFFHRIWYSLRIPCILYCRCSIMYRLIVETTVDGLVSWCARPVRWIVADIRSILWWACNDLVMPAWYCGVQAIARCKYIMEGQHWTQENYCFPRYNETLSIVCQMLSMRTRNWLYSINI